MTGFPFAGDWTAHDKRASNWLSTDLYRETICLLLGIISLSSCEIKFREDLAELWFRSMQCWTGICLAELGHFCKRKCEKSLKYRNMSTKTRLCQIYPFTLTGRVIIEKRWKLMRIFNNYSGVGHKTKLVKECSVEPILYEMGISIQCDILTVFPLTRLIILATFISRQCLLL